MVGKVAVFAALVILAIIFQTFFASLISVEKVMPDIFVILVVYLTLTQGLGYGVIFAFVYAAAMSLLEISSVAGCAGIGALMGLFHGFAMSFILIAVVSEKHPLPEFREAGFDVGIAHIAGHIAYGAVVGLLVGIFGIHYALGA